MEMFFGLVAQYGYGAIFALLMLGIVGLPVPDETVLLFVGYLVFKQTLSPWPALGAAFLGSVSGISLSYGLGRTVGRYLLGSLGPRFGLGSEQVDAVGLWFARWGRLALFFGYFIPGLRHLMALVAGSSKLPPSIFVLWAYSGALLWSAGFLALGYGLGEEWSRLSAPIHRALVIVAALGLVLVLGRLFVLRRKTVGRG